MNLGTTNSPAFINCIIGKLGDFPDEITMLPPNHDHPDYNPFKSDRLVKVYLENLLDETGIDSPEPGFFDYSQEELHMALYLLHEYKHDIPALLSRLNDLSFCRVIGVNVLRILKKSFARIVTEFHDFELVLRIIDGLDVLISRRSA